MRSSPLNRKSKLKRGKRLRRQSKKARAEVPARKACLEALWKRSGGWCEVRLTCCSGRMATGHEPFKRSRGGDETDPRQSVAICARCHSWIGDNEQAATMLKLLVPLNKGAGDDMDTTQLGTAIAVIGEETSLDVLLAAGDMLARMGELYREYRQAWESKMIQRVESSGGYIVAGDWIYSLKTPPKTTCNDVPATLDAILAATGGDFNVLSEHLSSGCIKYGAARQTLGDEMFAKLFTVTREPELDKTEATPKRLQKFNKQFAR